MRKLFRTVFIVFCILVFASASWARSPLEALSVRPAESFYMTAQVSDVSGLLRSIFSPANVEMLASVLDPGEIEALRLAASLASQVPARTLAFSVGVSAADKKPFFQLAASMPESAQAKLKLVADGKATGADLITLLAGEGALLLAAGLEPAVQQGAKGPYYLLGPGSPAFAARDDLLLVTLSPLDLEESLNALEDAQKRLALKRRFESPNFYMFHADFSGLDALVSEMDEISEPEAAGLKALSGLFQAPLEGEVAFESKQGSFLVSGGVNVMEALKGAAERFKDLKPSKGAGLFLAGGGKLLLALSSPMSFRAADWKVYPEFSKMWDKVLSELQERGLTEKDVEDFLTGSLTFAFGSDATFGGRKVPGGYLALRGKKGAAEKILNRITEDESFKQTVPLAPMKGEGWSSLFMLDPALAPVPVLVGVKDDALFLGVVDSQELEKRPQLSEKAEALFNRDLFLGGFLDAASIWDRIGQEFMDPASPLGAFAGLGAQGDAEFASELRNIAQGVLDAELPVPFIKFWASELESSYLEVDVADVPAERSLTFRLLEAVKTLESMEEDEEFDGEASGDEEIDAE